MRWTNGLLPGPLRFAHEWAASGLDMPFDPDFRAQLQLTMKDDEEFDHFLKGHSRTHRRRHEHGLVGQLAASFDRAGTSVPCGSLCPADCPAARAPIGKAVSLAIVKDGGIYGRPEHHRVRSPGPGWNQPRVAVGIGWARSLLAG